MLIKPLFSQIFKESTLPKTSAVSSLDDTLNKLATKTFKKFPSFDFADVVGMTIVVTGVLSIFYVVVSSFFSISEGVSDSTGIEGGDIESSSDGSGAPSPSEEEERERIKNERLQQKQRALDAFAEQRRLAASKEESKNSEP